MFWKHARKPSITTQLTVFYSLTTILLLSVVTLFFYGAAVHILHQVHYQFLREGSFSYTYFISILDSYTALLIETLIVGILLAILLGYLIARRSMKHLYNLTEMAHHISASSLHQRIYPQSWPKELNLLGITFNQMLDRIETSFKSLTQFSDDLAHELRNPINNIMGEMEIALSSAHTIAEYRQAMESCLEELQRIGQIIENLLYLARTENTQLGLKKIKLDANKEIQSICDYYEAIANEKNIQMSLVGNATLDANPIMFKRLINNILSNALKYTPNGGHIAFSINTNEKYTLISLQDSGIGISAEHLPHIFKRFYRVDAARTHDTGSVGLGLAIVKSIMELHHGTVTAISEIGKGTTIILTFPLAQP
ncbi:MAG TPA: heavy metal sensor histidine kinase [Gammaproteobacteria bacterium]|jgi:two-component system heavy metal sensor histidine kinase CusS|nr:heavy metal sensor histidine kinase [Gammaproteobacteria bacterium]